MEQDVTRCVLQRRSKAKIVQGELWSNTGTRRDKMCLAKTLAKRDWRERERERERERGGGGEGGRGGS